MHTFLFEKRPLVLSFLFSILQTKDNPLPFLIPGYHSSCSLQGLFFFQQIYNLHQVCAYNLDTWFYIEPHQWGSRRLGLSKHPYILLIYSTIPLTLQPHPPPNHGYYRILKLWQVLFSLDVFPSIHVPYLLLSLDYSWFSLPCYMLCSFCEAFSRSTGLELQVHFLESLLKLLG